MLTGAPKDAPVILLDHQPSDARNAAKLGVALQLSGHTHGGLIWGIDRLAARANAGFVSGRYDVDGMTLYVNNGTALWPGFALRLGRPSELTRITLRQAGAGLNRSELRLISYGGGARIGRRLAQVYFCPRSVLAAPAATSAGPDDEFPKMRLLPNEETVPLMPVVL